MPVAVSVLVGRFPPLCKKACSDVTGLNSLKSWWNTTCRLYLHRYPVCHSLGGLAISSVGTTSLYTEDDVEGQSQLIRQESGRLSPPLLEMVSV